MLIDLGSRVSVTRNADVFAICFVTASGRPVSLCLAACDLVGFVVLLLGQLTEAELASALVALRRVGRSTGGVS